MYLISTSFHVDAPVYDAVVDAVGRRYVKAAVDSGVFTNPVVAELMITVDPACRSFALTMNAADIDLANRWLETEGAAIVAALESENPRRVVHFTTPMRIIG